MKCPNCNQEMIEKKDFCINCGKRLIKEKQVSKKGIIVFMILMVIVGFITCYLIINLNTDKEIEPYIKGEYNVRKGK